jgi:hypothetical protein
MYENGIIMLSGLTGGSQHGSGDMLASEESFISYFVHLGRIQTSDWCRLLLHRSINKGY